MKLTQNFDTNEIFKGSRSGKIAPHDMNKALRLCRNLLQPVRDRYGAVIISSGKRSKTHNNDVGGSKTSDHLFYAECAAVDFTLKESGENKLAYTWIAQNCGGAIPEFGQLIAYIDEQGEVRWVHVSLPSRKHVGKMLITSREVPRAYRNFEGEFVA